MNDATPPPERPLPDGSRARIRADLLGHAHENRSSAPRWLVPAGAAAAVALVAGVGYWADTGRWRWQRVERAGHVVADR
jgi:hypothetical protein